MKIEFDPSKDAANLAKHNISLARAADLEVLAAVEDIDFQTKSGFGLMALSTALRTALPTRFVTATSVRSACEELTQRR